MKRLITAIAILFTLPIFGQVSDVLIQDTIDLYIITNNTKAIAAAQDNKIMTLLNSYKLNKDSIDVEMSGVSTIPLTVSTGNATSTTGSAAYAFSDLASGNDTLALGSAVGRDDDLIIVSRNDITGDSVVITGAPAIYYSSAGYTTFYLDWNKTGAVIESDGTAWYVHGVWETREGVYGTWERDTSLNYVYTFNPTDSVIIGDGGTYAPAATLDNNGSFWQRSWAEFDNWVNFRDSVHVNGKATFDSVVYVEDQFKMVNNNCYLGYDPKGIVEDRYMLMRAEDGDTIASIAAYAYSLSGVSMAAQGNGLSSSLVMNYQEDLEKKTQIYMISSNQIVPLAQYSSRYFMYPDSIAIEVTLDSNKTGTVIEILNNYIDIATDSVNINSAKLIYEDTFWDDLTFPASQIKLGATSKPDYDFTELSLLFPYSDSTELIVANVQIPHKWKSGTSIYPHVHWVQPGANDTAEFILKYRWTDMGETVGSYTRIETTVCTYYAYSSGDLHQLAIFPAISGSGHTGSSILDIILFRKEDVGLNGDIEVKNFDIHFEIDKPGSSSEIP